MENKGLRMVFPIFLGVLIAVFVGYGLQVFYPRPQFSPAPDGGLEAYTVYEQAMGAYSRTVSLVASAIAAVPLVVGALLPRRLVVLADGLLLGGMSTLVYAAAQGMGSEEGFGTAVSFAAAGLGFLLALGTLYVRQAGWGRRVTPAAHSAPDADDATLAVVAPLAAAPLASFAVLLGIQTFFTRPTLAGYAGPGYPTAMVDYARDSGLLASAAALVLLAAGTAVLRRASIPADALLLGGLVVLVVGSARAISPTPPPVSFIAGVLALVVALAVGHLRLVGKRWSADSVAGATSGPRSGSRMFAVVHPLATGALTVAVFYLGVNAFYPEPIGQSYATWLRTTSLSGTAVAVALLVASLAMGRISSAGANALLVSGVFALIAGVAPAAMAGEQAVVFIALAVALLVVLFVGYRRFAGRGTKRPTGIPPVPPAPAA